MPGVWADAAGRCAAGRGVDAGSEADGGVVREDAGMVEAGAWEGAGGKEGEISKVAAAAAEACAC